MMIYILLIIAVSLAIGWYARIQWSRIVIWYGIRRLTKHWAATSQHGGSIYFDGPRIPGGGTFGECEGCQSDAIVGQQTDRPWRCADCGPGPTPPVVPAGLHGGCIECGRIQGHRHKKACSVTSG